MGREVTGIVLTHNNEATIARCLNSISWCSEIIVVDDSSKDDTCKKASQFGARIYQRSLSEDFASQRNFAMACAKNEWILFVDSDEVVSDQLAKEIETTVRSPLHETYRIPRINEYFGKRLHFGEFFHYSVVRFGKKNSGRWVGAIHETWNCSRPVGLLHSPLYHFQQGGIQDFLRKINFYSTIKAKEFHEMRKSTGFLEILFFPYGKFIVNYFLKLGFLDGVAGLMNALSMSFYTFLVRAKLWLLWHEASSKD